MARPEDARPAAEARAALRREEGALAPFFDAARAEDAAAPLPDAFLAAVLRDAAAATPAPSSPAAALARPLHRPGPRPATGRRRSGWAASAAAALAACLGFGFVAGALGAGAGTASTLLADGAGLVWSDTAALDAPAAGLDAFFDLAAEES